MQTDGTNTFAGNLYIASFSFAPVHKVIWSLLNNHYTKKGLKQYQYSVTMPVSTHLLSLLHSLSSVKWDCGSVFLLCSRSGVIAVPGLWLQTSSISSPDAAVFKPWLKSTCHREQGLGNDELWAVDKRWWEKERVKELAQLLNNVVCSAAKPTWFS